MKQYLLLLLAVLGLLASIPTESNAQVSVSVNPGYSRDYYSRDSYSRGYYYQRQPYYRHYYYHHYNHRHHWHYQD